MILGQPAKSRRKGGSGAVETVVAPRRPTIIWAEGMKMTAMRFVGPEAGARKYDLLTGIGAAALRIKAQRVADQRNDGDDAAAEGQGADDNVSSFSPVTALRLIVLITARYDWARDSAAVGHAELERLWGVSRRTVIREIDRLRRLGLLKQLSEGRRGRVSVYRLDQAHIAALTKDAWSCVGDKFADRMAAIAPDAVAPGVAGGSVVALFPQPDAAEPAATAADANTRDAHTHELWHRLVAALAQEMPRAALQRWVAPLICRRFDAARLDLEAPSRFHADFVARAHGEALRRAAAQCGLAPARMRIMA